MFPNIEFLISHFSFLLWNFSIFLCKYVLLACVYVHVHIFLDKNFKIVQLFTWQQYGALMVLQNKNKNEKKKKNTKKQIT